MSTRRSRRQQALAGCLVSVVIAASAVTAAAVARLVHAPPYTADLLCTWDRLYQVTATLEVDGRRLTASAIRQTTRSRDWVYNLNMNGCPSPRGQVLVFRDGPRVLLMGTSLCAAATEALDAEGTVDVKRACLDERRDRGTHPDGFVVDDAARPGSWRPFWHGDDVRVVAWTAASVWQDPADDLDRLAPEIGRTEFVGAPQGQSPHRLGFPHPAAPGHVAVQEAEAGASP